jgi:peptide subunit release factor 1 (eRF1)
MTRVTRGRGVTEEVKHESEEEILDRSLLLLERDERQRELERVNLVIDGAASESGRSAVVGVQDTLEALNARAVRDLVLVDDLRVEGVECQACSYLRSCPVCGAWMEPSSNIVERAVEQACLSDANVDVVFGEARAQLLAKDGIGGLLRF